MFSGLKARVRFVLVRVLDLVPGLDLDPSLDLDQSRDLVPAPNRRPLQKPPLLSRQKSQQHQRQKAVLGAPRAALRAPKVLRDLDKLVPRVALQAPKVLRDPNQLPLKIALLARAVALEVLKAAPKAQRAAPEAQRVVPEVPKAAQEVHPPLAPALRAPKKRVDVILSLDQRLETALKQAPDLLPARTPRPLPLQKMLMEMNEWTRTNNLASIYILLPYLPFCIELIFEM